MFCHVEDGLEVDIHEVTEHWVRKTAYMLEKGLAYRQEGNNQKNFTDLRYKDLVSDSMGQMDYQVAFAQL